MTMQRQAANGEFYLSELEPDVAQPVQVAQAWAQAAEEEFYLSEPEPDVAQPVQVAQAWAQAAEEEFYLSEPEPDVVQPVQVAQAWAQAAEDSAVADVQLGFKEVDYENEIGTNPDPVVDSDRPDADVILDLQEIYHIIREVAVADSGDDLYRAISADREYQTPGHPAYQRRQFGLGYGLVLFTQESGLLGAVLNLMYRRDPDQFETVFGPASSELLAVTNAATPAERLQPVGGEPLTSAGWIARFRQAGGIELFQAAQNEAAIELQFRPMLNVAFSLGLTSDRGLAMVCDRVVTRGLGAGLRWVVQAAGSLRTAAQRSYALQTLGYQTLSDFQAATGWVAATGTFGPETHAAMIGALRAQGSIPMPRVSDLTARLVAAAQGTPRRRLLRLQTSTKLEDVMYRLR